MSDRVRLLAAFLCGALFIKYLLVPWVEGQYEDRMRLQALSNKLARSEALLIDQTEILKMRDQSVATVNSFRGRLPLGISADVLRLQTQDRLGAMAAKRSLQVTVFDWILDGAVDAGDTRFAKARLQVSGSVSGFGRFQSEIEGGFPNAVIRSVRAFGVAEIAGPGDTGVSAELVIDFYYRTSSGRE
jgi:hypothetical protein